MDGCFILFFYESVQLYLLGRGVFCKKRNKLLGIDKVCCKIASSALNSLNEKYKIRSVKKSRMILMDPEHPLRREFKLLPSRRRSLLPRCRTIRLKNSFVSAALRFLNEL
ncbi:hypothetical protein ILYODFUR_023345 [Ilyodon furcidens]|uniref:Uncharacterized protein n=1 Tax=Ilyodon furcidens TaxID=33524 RepID=A0ABV0TBW3_9TELE